MPIGILGSRAVCTVLYILVSGLLTSMVNYRQLNVPDPVAVGIDVAGIRWGSFLVKLGAIFGLGTVMLVMLLGQSRVFYSMSRDNLLPKWVSKIHPRFRTPWISTIIVGIAVAFLPALLPISDLGHLVSIGTLLAFVIVCAGVWMLRYKRPSAAVQNAGGSFRAYYGHGCVPLPYGESAVGDLGTADYLARNRLCNLFRIWPQTQPGSKEACRE
jgi:APA family basic amino acid/polyamine antiporter